MITIPEESWDLSDSDQEAVQVAEHRAGSARHRRRYVVTELTAICGAAAVTQLPSLVVAGLSALVLIATGVRTTFGLHENWVANSRIRYAIEREVALYLVKAPPYADSGKRADAERVAGTLDVPQCQLLLGANGERFRRRCR